MADGLGEAIRIRRTHVVHLGGRAWLWANGIIRHHPQDVGNLNPSDGRMHKEDT
jgi:hypothetical protein